MNVKVINGTSLPNIPWQDRPAGCKDVIWRADNNPIIPRDLLPTSNSIFNSAVVPFESERASSQVFSVLTIRKEIWLSTQASLRMAYTGTSTKKG